MLLHYFLHISSLSHNIKKKKPGTIEIQAGPSAGIAKGKNGHLVVVCLYINCTFIHFF